MSTATLHGTAARWMLAGILATVALGGCVPKQMAKGATAGALEEVKEQNKARPDGPPPTQDLASNFTRGTVAELERDQTREQLGHVVDTTVRTAVTSAMNALTRPQWGYQRWGDLGQGFPARPLVGPPAPGGVPVAPLSPAAAFGGKMAEGFTLGMSRQLQIELGPNGEGPLGQTMAGVIREATQAAISGATTELAPADCAGLSAQDCADRRMHDLSRSAAKGFVDGLGISLQIPLLVAAFAAGVIGSLIVFLLLRLRRPVLIATDAGPIRRVPQTPQTHGA